MKPINQHSLVVPYSPEKDEVLLIQKDDWGFFEAPVKFGETLTQTANELVKNYGKNLILKPVTKFIFNYDEDVCAGFVLLTKDFPVTSTYNDTRKYHTEKVNKISNRPLNIKSKIFCEVIFSENHPKSLFDLLDTDLTEEDLENLRPLSYDDFLLKRPHISKRA